MGQQPRKRRGKVLAAGAGTRLSLVPDQIAWHSSMSKRSAAADIFPGGAVQYAVECHPDEDALESHALGKVRGAKLARIEEHLLVCVDCQKRLAELDEFVGALREAAGGVLEAVSWTHLTTEGTVQLHASKSRSRQWVARIQGRDVEGGRAFPSLLEACTFLHRSFAELYPEHRCTRHCRHEE
jgi:hypothetical protein